MTEKQGRRKWRDAPALEQAQQEQVQKGRVEFAAFGTHVLGSNVAYVAARHYATHSETWCIVETDNDSTEDIKPESAFVRGRDGKVWAVWHNFYHTEQAATEYAVTMAQEYSMELWHFNVFLGTL